MKREELFSWVKKTYHIEPDHPWADANAVLRHPENNKWFALVMEVGKDKLGLRETGTVDVVNVKCEPAMIGFLRTQQGFHPAYHMNKDQWLTIRLDGSVPETEIQNLIDLSFQLTAPKPKKKRNRNCEGTE